MLAAAAAALFVKSVLNTRRSDPARALEMSTSIKAAALGAVAEGIVNGIARSVAALLKSLWGAPVQPSVRTVSRIGEPVGEGA